MAISFNDVKKAAAVSAAVGSVFKTEERLTDPGGHFGVFLRNINKSGISRNNKFMLQIDPPATASIVGGRTERFTIYAIDVDIPVKEVYTEASRIYGTSEELPVDTQYGLTFQATFYVDTAYSNVEFFSRWIDAVVDPVSRDIEYNNKYVGTVTVSIIDNKIINANDILRKRSIGEEAKRAFMKNFDDKDKKYGDPTPRYDEVMIASYSFSGVYPKSMQIKRLSNNSKEYQEVTVVFAYERIKPLYKFAITDFELPVIDNKKKPSFTDKLLGNVTSKVTGLAGTAGAAAGSIANIARIGG